MSKSIAGFCIALIWFAAMPAHAETINLSCYAGNSMINETDRYRIDLDARTATLLETSNDTQGQITDHTDDISHPITEIDDQYVVWEEIFNGQVAGLWRIDRSTLLLGYRNNGEGAYTNQAQCKILHNQF
jgi:hypothetical protein